MNRKFKISNKRIYGHIFRKRLLKMIISALFVFLILLGILFYFFEQFSYKQNLQKSTDNMAFQIAATSEIVLRNIKDSVNRTIIYDNSAFTLSEEARETRVGKIQILDMLKSLSIANEHIHSSYLYYPQDNTVYTSQSAPATIVPFSAFNDSYAFSKINDKDTYTLPPRLLNTKIDIPISTKNLPLAVTIVSGAPINSVSKSSYLAVNVDIEGLFSNLFSKMQIDQSMNFYILAQESTSPDSDLTIVYHKDRNKIFSTMPHPTKTKLEKNVVVSTYYSDILKWEFVIENHSEPVRPTVLKQFSVVFIFLLFIFLVMLVLLLFYTIPINKLATNAQNAHWRELLTSSHLNNIDFAEEIMQFSSGSNFSKYSSFGVVSIVSNGNINLSSSFIQKINDISNSMFGNNRDSFSYQIVRVSPQNTTVVVAFSEKNRNLCASELQLFAYEVSDNFKDDLASKYICCISTIKKDINLLPLAYKEAMSVTNYKYLLEPPILLYSKIVFESTPYIFPEEFERQLINNLVVGNTEGCHLFLSKIFDSFSSSHKTLRDEEINQHIYLIINNIMRQLMSLPMSIQIDYKVDYQNHSSLLELREDIDTYIEKVVEKVNAQGGDNSLALGNCIIGYINSNFSDPDIDLGTISDEFSLNKNYVSRIIKEITGKSFPEYLNDSRIEKSKRLLETTNMTIKEISEEIGFAYSYYFIRVFKQSQGLTPGEYKKISKAPKN